MYPAVDTTKGKHVKTKYLVTSLSDHETLERFDGAEISEYDDTLISNRKLRSRRFSQKCVGLYAYPHICTWTSLDED